MASFMFQQQARAFLLVAARFSRLYQYVFVVVFASACLLTASPCEGERSQSQFC